MVLVKFDKISFQKSVAELSKNLSQDDFKSLHDQNSDFLRLCEALKYIQDLLIVSNSNLLLQRHIQILNIAAAIFQKNLDLNSFDLNEANQAVDKVLEIFPNFLVFRLKNKKDLNEAREKLGEFNKESEYALSKIKEIKNNSLEAKKISENIEDSQRKINAAKIEILGDNSNETGGLLSQIKTELSELHEKAEITKAKCNDIEDAVEKIIDGSDDENSYLTEIENAHAEVEKYLAKAKVFYQQLVGTPPKGSNYEDAIKSHMEGIKEDRANIAAEREKIKSYSISLFGKEDEKGNTVGGLKSDIAKTKKDFDAELDSYAKKSEAAFNEIESLLHGATSAGLAEAYKERLKKCERSKRYYTGAFYISIFLLVGLMCFSSNITSYLWGKNFLTDANLAEKIIAKLILVAPLIWVASFASNRSNEMTRLIEEYGHKKALAQSYYGFKKQIEALEAEDLELSEKLLKAALESLAYNASDSLDKAKRENHPLMAFLLSFIGKRNKSREGES